MEELTDLHLLAEYRELPRISKAARVCEDAPTRYKLGAGHVKFFYDKGAYLKHRFENEIVPEMKRRGFKPNYTVYRQHADGLNNMWWPDDEARAINRARIQERLEGK